MKKAVSLLFVCVMLFACMSVSAATTIGDAASLETALANGGDYQLTADITLEKMLTVPAGKTVVLDLNGYTITAGFSAGSGNDCALCVAYGADLTISDTAGNGGIDGSKVYGAIKLTNTGDSSENGTAKLTVGGGTLTGNYYAVVGNGSRSGTEIVINGGKLTATQEVWSYGIFHPQNGTLTVNDGEIIAGTGIEMRAGTLIVNGGTIASNATELTTSPSDSGSTVSGAAIAVSQHTTNHPISVTVNEGATLQSEAGGYALYQDRLITEKSYATSGASTNLTVEIAAGATVTGTVEAAEETFDINAAEDGSYSITAVVAKIGETSYETLQAAVDAAAAGDTIELLSDVNEKGPFNIYEGDDITVSGNGYTISCEDGFYVTGGKLTLGEGLTVDASVYNAVYLRGGEVITSANLYSNSAYAAIQGNGSYVGDVTIKGGDIANKTPGVAIYWPQNGKLTIEGGTITGSTAVYLKSGSLEITGGTLTGTGEASDYEHVASGATPTGEALVIENVNAAGYEAISGVSITGGTFVSEKAASAVGSYAYNEEVESVTGFISGGSFSSDVSAHLTYGSSYDASTGEVAASAASAWSTDTDAGYYEVEGVKTGMMRFLFAAEVEGEVTASGIMYIKGKEITTQVGERETGSSNAFYGDIVGIGEGESGTYYAVAYITTAEGTVWSDPLPCTINWTKQFTNYGGAQ